MTFAKNEDKQKVLETHLSQDSYLMIHFNPSLAGVLVPENFKQSATLTLKLSYQFQGVTEFKSDHIRAELSFNGNYFMCEIPYVSIWGCTTEAQKNYIWPESLSANSFSALSSEIQSIKKPQLALKKTEAMAKDATEEKVETESETPVEKPERKRPTLTRIK